jgi:hypothetical protein
MVDNRYKTYTILLSILAALLMVALAITVLFPTAEKVKTATTAPEPYAANLAMIRDASLTPYSVVLKHNNKVVGSFKTLGPVYVKTESGPGKSTPRAIAIFSTLDGNRVEVSGDWLVLDPK